MGNDTLGAILMQKDEKSLFMQSNYFARRMMTSVEKGYNHSKKMFLSLMFGVTKFRSTQKVCYFDLGGGFFNHPTSCGCVPKNC